MKESGKVERLLLIIVMTFKDVHMRSLCACGLPCHKKKKIKELSLLCHLYLLIYLLRN